MKTPDEIKKGLFVCSDFEGNCPYCPYAVNGHIDHEGMCMKKLANDADVLVRQLEAQNAEKDERIRQLEAERTELLNLLEQFGQCVVCEHTDKGTNESPCCDCWLCNGDAKCSNWQWRGVQKEDDDD